MKIIFSLLIFGLVGWQLFKQFKFVHSLTQFQSIIGDFLENINSKPIKEIEVRDINDLTPDTYFEVRGWDFPGMKGFCNCDGKLEAKCGPECVKVDKLNAQKLSIWHGKKIIFQRYKKKEVVQAKVKIIREQEFTFHCPEGFKECGNGWDCVKSYVKCPITELTVNQNRKEFIEPSEENEVLDQGEHELIIGRAKIDGNSQTAQRILNNLQIGWNGMPCFDPKSDHKRHSHAHSELAGHLGKDGCTKPLQENLQNYESVDNITLDNFLRTNNLNSYIDNVPKSELEHFYPELIHFLGRYSIQINPTNEACTNMDKQIFDTFKISLDIYIWSSRFLMNFKVFIGILLLFVMDSKWRKVLYISLTFLFQNLVYLSFELGIFPFLKKTSVIVNNAIFQGGSNHDLSCLGPTHWGQIMEYYFKNINQYFEQEEKYCMIQCGVLAFFVFVGFAMMKISKENQGKDIVRQADVSKKEKTD